MLQANQSSALICAFHIKAPVLQVFQSEVLLHCGHRWEVKDLGVWCPFQGGVTSMENRYDLHWFTLIYTVYFQLFPQISRDNVDKPWQTVQGINWSILPAHKALGLLKGRKHASTRIWLNLGQRGWKRQDVSRITRPACQRWRHCTLEQDAVWCCLPFFLWRLQFCPNAISCKVYKALNCSPRCLYCVSARHRTQNSAPG